VRRRVLVAGAALLGAGALVAVLVAVLSGGGREQAPSPTTTAPPTSAPPSPPAPPPSLPAPQGTEIGMNVNRLFNDRTYSPQRIDDLLTTLRATGVTLARSDVLWEVAEPEPPGQDGVHHYDWSFADGVAGALARHGIQWLALVDYATPWSASVPGNTHSPPRDPADFAAFARAFAERYGRGGAFWAEHPDVQATPVTTYEIWNEPDLSIFWAPGPDPARYMDLYVDARVAIKDADPQARVIIGGLSNAPGFIPQLFAARPDVRGQLDGVAVHPYARTALGVLDVVRKSRRALDAAGVPDTPIYVTELGWVTHPRTSLKYAPPGRRARDIHDSVASLARVDCGVAAVVLYTWVTPEKDPADEEDWFGVLHPDGRPSAAGRAFDSAVRTAQSADGEPRIRLCGSA
jgi:hypothetical protein